MKVNPVTKLWEELTPQEAVDLRQWAENVVLCGKLAYPDPPWLTLWYETLGYRAEHQRIMMQSTAVPQFVLLSLVHSLEQVVVALLPSEPNSWTRTLPSN